MCAAQGMENIGIAQRLGIAPNTALKWRKRFFEEGLAGLEDRPRSGRPRSFPPQLVAQVKATACQLPSTRGSRSAASRRPRSPGRWCRPAWWRRSASPPWAAGWLKTPSAPGTTASGSSPATPASQRRRGWCWTSTRASSRGNPWGRPTT
ncbi:MAG: helix-turn-helix domain-containing protein [Actinomycetota bacterium]|nr:helix-turn-helix domain-containing protein [Actinomycetota bacterium]